VIAAALAIDLQWNERTYAFEARTGRRLKIWARETTLADVVAEDLLARLPEALPPAHPRATGLDFMELELYGQTSLYEEREGFRRSSLGNLRQTFWGSLAHGRYKLRVAERSLLFDRGTLQDDDTTPVMVDWGEWTYALRDAEVTLGDSAFGLSDLIFPRVTMTGVRINGVAGGLSPEEAAAGSPGLARYFVESYNFEGYARAGSRVQLLINDRLVDEREVVADSPTKPGQGAYRFEDVRLEAGVLNDVRLVITDPDGVETQIRKTILPTSRLLPKGRLAYLGAVGTSREIDQWRTRGVFSAARGLYGLSDRLTVGGTVARQHDFFEKIPTDSLVADERGYPTTSTHAGGQVAWHPLDALLVSASAAATQQTEDAGTFEETAWQGKVDVYPTRDLSLGGEMFRYGPNFFNGQNLHLHDREGYALYGRWRPHAKWTLSGSVGSVRNNLDGDLAETLRVDYVHSEIATTAVPRTNLSAAFDRTLPSSTDEPQNLLTLRGRSQLPWDVTVYGEVAAEDLLTPAEDTEFFSGLAVPGLALYQTPSAAAAVVKSLSWRQSVSGNYWKTGSRQRASFVHSYRSGGTAAIQWRTEIGMDIFRRDLAEQYGLHRCFFENRAEYLFDVTGRNRVGLQTRFERDEWTCLLYVSLSNRFALWEDRPVHITDLRVEPDRGAIQGRVFLDYNANARPDPGEPGLEGVKVRVSRTLTATTDSRGYYLLPGLRSGGEVRVALDLETVPATYTPTHGTQRVFVRPRSLTEANLGLAPANWVSGMVRAPDSQGKFVPLAGVRVSLADRQRRTLVTDSITASDGTYYLGNVLPGQYVLRVDAETLPRGYTVAEPTRSLDVLPKEEPQDLAMEPFTASGPPAPAPSPVPAEAPQTAPESDGGDPSPDD